MFLGGTWGKLQFLQFHRYNNIHDFISFTPHAVGRKFKKNINFYWKVSKMLCS